MVKPKCWGCECSVPLNAKGQHEEPTDIPGQVYVYSCTALGKEKK